MEVQMDMKSHIGLDESALNFLAQILEHDDCRRVVHDAMTRYAAQTIGRDKSYAEDVANLMLPF
jgi:hypothetical protein